MRVWFCLLWLLTAMAGACLGRQPDQPVKWPGLQPDGSVLLHNQWSVRPAGRQVDLGNCLPVNVAIEPKGRFAAVLLAGYTPHEVLTVDLNARRVACRAPLRETFYGLAFSADGGALYCSGAGDEVVYRFDFRDGQLTNPSEIQVHDRSLRGVPCGLALDRAGKRLFVADVFGDSVAEVSLGPKPSVNDISVGVKPAQSAMTPIVPLSGLGAAGGLFGNNPLYSRLLHGMINDVRRDIGFYGNDPEYSFPYACCLDEKRRRLYASLWSQSAVSVIDLDSATAPARWPTEEHPCEMVLTRSGGLLYVANANRNTVSVLDTSTGKTLETIWAAFFPDSPPGSTPNSLALSPDQKTLFVANANVNAIAVFDVSRPGKSSSWGFIPVGWYPTSVRVTPDGRRLLVANGKGATAKSNSNGGGYDAALYDGTLSIIDLPAGKKWPGQMAAWTAAAYACAPLKAEAAVAAVPPPGNPIPARVGDPSPIKYVIYIIKENCTYDQILGDMARGNGDANVCLFPERVTPNHHKIAQDFVLLDNFYADAEVSSSGHEWSMGAYCSDFVEKTWPLNSGHNANGKFPNPGQGHFRISAPVAGYLWDRAREAGLSYRSYGEFVSYDQPTNQPARPRVKALQNHIDPMYRGFDLAYSDLKRAARFISEFKRLEASGQMPRLQIVCLPNDHTHGATPTFPTPSAYLGQNDLALGRIIEAVSHSTYWPQTAVFVVEDDAQNGSDHVDAHRTVALVASPYAKRGVKDSTMYSTTSMLRTMELILGLKPMSQFDAAAMPMFDSFQSTPDARPYEPAQENINLDEKNRLTAWGARLKMNFAKEDAADEFLLNEAIWKSVRGADSPMPAPFHAAFVFDHKRQGDDGD